MEYGFYLMSLVLGCALFHLISRAIEQYASWRIRTGKNAIRAYRQSPERDDWYVFFRSSSLTGSPQRPPADRRPENRTGASNSRRPPQGTVNRKSRRAQRPSARMVA